MVNRECPECGASIPGDGLTCPDCGNNLASISRTDYDLSSTETDGDASINDPDLDETADGSLGTQDASGSTEPHSSADDSARSSGTTAGSGTVLNYTPLIGRLTDRQTTIALTVLLLVTFIGIVQTGLIVLQSLAQDASVMLAVIIGLVFLIAGVLPKRLLYLILFLPPLLIAYATIVIGAMTAIVSIGSSFVGESLIQSIVAVLGGLLAASFVIGVTYYGIAVAGMLLAALAEAVITIVVPATIVGSVGLAFGTPVGVVLFVLTLVFAARYTHITDVLLTSTIGAAMLTAIANGRSVFLRSYRLLTEIIGYPLSGEVTSLDVSGYRTVVEANGPELVDIFVSIVFESLLLFTLLSIAGTVIQYTWLYHPLWIAKYANDVSNRVPQLEQLKDYRFVESLSKTYVGYATTLSIHHEDSHPLREDSIPSVAEFYSGNDS